LHPKEDIKCQTKIRQDLKAVGHRQARAAVKAKAQRNHKVVRLVLVRVSAEIRQ